MRRIALWASSTVATLVLLFGYHTSTSGVVAGDQQPIGAAFTPTTSATTSGAGPDTNGSEGAGSSGSSGSSATAGTTVTGDTVQTRWGPVQVQITVDSASITDVQVVQYPSGNGKDVEINNYALPVLIDETMSAQSADIDMVGGATLTSEGYLGSLQSALDQAGL